MKRITVLLAEDHVIVREGFRKMLEMEDDLEVVGEAPDGREAVALARALRPDVILMDVAMPRLNGFQATRQVRRFLPGTKVLILSGHSDEVYVTKATEAGASGFLLKRNSTHDVCRAIREVHRGKKFFLSATKPEKAKLTAREMEVLQLVAEGRPNKETALELGIGRKTVEKHRENLMAKLNIHDTARLTRYAIAQGIIEGAGPRWLTD